MKRIHYLIANCAVNCKQPVLLQDWLISLNDNEFKSIYNLNLKFTSQGAITPDDCLNYEFFLTKSLEQMYDIKVKDNLPDKYYGKAISAFNTILTSTRLVRQGHIIYKKGSEGYEFYEPKKYQQVFFSNIKKNQVIFNLN